MGDNRISMVSPMHIGIDPAAPGAERTVLAAGGSGDTKFDIAEARESYRRASGMILTATPDGTSMTIDGPQWVLLLAHFKLALDEAQKLIDRRDEDEAHDE